jgi:hypothetical protein
MVDRHQPIEYQADLILRWQQVQYQPHYMSLVDMLVLLALLRIYGLIHIPLVIGHGTFHPLLCFALLCSSHYSLST